jgi:hypothetical protein
MAMERRKNKVGIRMDISYKSLNKYTEELCGDKVEILKTKDSSILILADGMGSGVKANILSTLTSKILGTMLLNGSSIDECVETLAKTLPICQVRHIAYSTFSILQIFNNGNAYLVEYDNPGCVFIRNNQILKIPSNERMIENKLIKEYRFKVDLNDCFVLMSDGAIHAGVGECLNFGWTWEHVANYALKASQICRSATRLATNIAEACNDLYVQRPGDDTTIAVARIIPSKIIHLFTGPPLSKEDDSRLVEDFMKDEGKKVVCGGTSANILARELNLPIHTTLSYSDPDIPPTASIKGIDLVTEGVLTLSRTLTLLKTYLDKGGDEKFFEEIDKENGGSQLAKLFLEDCTNISLYVGKAINTAHQNPALPFDLSIRMNLIEQLKETLTKLGKQVTVTYY